MATEDLVAAFAILLVLGSALLLFAPMFYRLMRRGMWALGFIVLVPAFVVASVGTTFIELIFSDPMLLAPIVAFVFAARVISPTLAFFKVREKLYRAGAWGGTKALAFLGFLAFGLYVGYSHFVAPESATGDPVLATEKLVMAFGTAFIFLRLHYRLMPKESRNMMMTWGAAVLFSLAFAVVAPYAFPDYQALYAVSGVMGWLIGAAVIAKSP